ncbi:MAG: ABC transporter substrate-binding protein [Caldanaerobacter sp.]|uniref:ABC transporter substrate-binding protein n=1 Tax=Caldanaerobacter sp. TaxID=2930036 RepID=UPI003C718819
MEGEKRNWFKDMTLKEKLQYIWDYYKIHIVIGLLLIYVLTMFTLSLINRKEYILNIALIGERIDFDMLSQFSNEVTKEIIGDHAGKKEASVDFYKLMRDYHGDLVLDPASTQKLIARIAAKEIDVIILDKKTFDALAVQGAFLKLDGRLEGLNLNRYKVVKAVEDTNGVKKGIYGIYVNPDNKYLKKLGYDYHDKIIAILSNSQHKDLSLKFLKWLLGG